MTTVHKTASLADEGNIYTRILPATRRTQYYAPINLRKLALRGHLIPKRAIELETL